MCTKSVACTCVQRRGGTPVIRVEGEDHTGVFGSHGEDWHTRRRILSPAFSAHKMKLVRGNESEYNYDKTWGYLCIIDSSI